MRVYARLCLLLFLGAALSGQIGYYDAAIFCHHAGVPVPVAVVLYDSAGGAVTTLVQGTMAQASRGGIFGPFGLIYQSAWTVNGIMVYDPKAGQ